MPLRYLPLYPTMTTADHIEPGTRCPTCARRVPKPRQETSPESKEIRVRLPIERHAWAEDAFDALQEVGGFDPESYPRGTLFEAMLVIAGQHREDLQRFAEARAGV